MKHYFHSLKVSVNGVSARLIVPSIQSPREALMSSQQNFISKMAKEVLEFRANVIVPKDLLLCKLISPLTQDAYLVLSGLEACLLVKVCDDVARSPADDRKEAVHGQVRAHPPGGQGDFLWLRGFLGADEVLESANGEPQRDVGPGQPGLCLHVLDGHQDGPQLRVCGVEVHVLCSLQTQTILIMRIKDKRQKTKIMSTLSPLAVCSKGGQAWPMGCVDPPLPRVLAEEDQWRRRL